ncbi:MAG: hypothetical protein RBR16_08655 [Syntrophus sp. (in: bacteria)]|nr:hypothetical protein [Syntrophus sp. (in: bacteria)]
MAIRSILSEFLHGKVIIPQLQPEMTVWPLLRMLSEPLHCRSQISPIIQRIEEPQRIKAMAIPASPVPVTAFTRCRMAQHIPPRRTWRPRGINPDKPSGEQYGTDEFLQDFSPICSGMKPFH